MSHRATPRSVRGETDLVRAPGLWVTGPLQLTMPVEEKGLNGIFVASGRLRMTPDFDIWAWLLERWASGDRDPAGVVRFTLYEMGHALYERRPGGEERRLMRESLARLTGTLVYLDSWDVTTSRPGSSLVPIFKALGSPGRLFERPTAAELGSMRGDTYHVQLNDWLVERLRSGFVTYLDWRVLRQLDGVAKRLWIALEAETFKRVGQDKSAWAVGLGRPALATLGVGHYKDHRRARLALREAGKRIVAADAHYDSVTVERRPGGYSLLATRVSGDALAAKRREQEEIWDHLAASGWEETADLRRSQRIA